MSELVDRLRAIGARVAAGADPPPTDGVRVVRRGDGTPNSVEVAPPGGLTLAALETELGAGTAVPKARPGPARTSFAGDGYSVLAFHDAGGAVSALTVVRDT